MSSNENKVDDIKSEIEIGTQYKNYQIIEPSEDYTEDQMLIDFNSDVKNQKKRESATLKHDIFKNLNYKVNSINVS